MYSKEALAKCMRLAREAGAHYQEIPVEEIQICISNGNRKIGRVLNVSLMPMLTCGNCSGCSRYCYDIKACLQYPDTVIDARMRNTILVQRDMVLYFHLIDERMSHRRTNKFFRWHVAGEIIGRKYLEHMIELALKHSDFVIWTYTKMYDVVNDYVRDHGGDRLAAIPGNLHIMFSKWDGMPMHNPYGFPVFACRLKAGNVDTPAAWFKHAFKCPGNCDYCKTHNTGCIAGMDTYADEH